MPPRKAKTRGCPAGTESGAARFRWRGQMKKPLALVVAIAAPLAALTAGTSALSPPPQRASGPNYLWTIPSTSGSLRPGPTTSTSHCGWSACATT